MHRYCLDSNVLIEAWHHYYSPIHCHGYWEIIDSFAHEGRIIIPQNVSEEIEKVDDDLRTWLRARQFMIKPVTADVQKCLKDIYAKDVRHQRLVDNTRNRSQADPWVIATAMAEKAVVVTKEEKITNPNSEKIKIPNVCDAMEIPCIDDFQMIRELGIHFDARR